MVMWFIDAVISMNRRDMILYASLYGISFIVTQIVSYIFSMMVGRVEANNFTNFFSRVNERIKCYDPGNSNLDINDLNQQIGQNYEIANPHFFIKPVEVVFSILNVLALFIMMFVLNWKITLILLVVVPISFFVSKKFEKRMYRNADENLKSVKNVKEYLNDQFRLSKEERFLNKKQLSTIDLSMSGYKKTQYAAYKTKSVYLYFFVYAFINFAILLVILLSGYFTYEGVMGIGMLYAFQNYTSQLWNPCEFLMSYKADLQEAKPAIEELDSLLSLSLSEYSNEKIKTIELRNFEALDRDGNIINNPINYLFEAGNTYIICGENGSGKTTLIEGILGFNRRYSGSILINNKNIISDDVVYISADSYFSRFYNREFKQASSGERKLEQIKLFLETDKSTYIFDEPTNFIDDSNKKLIIDLISELDKRNKLVIVVSHDKDLISRFNNVLYITKIKL